MYRPASTVHQDFPLCQIYVTFPIYSCICFSFFIHYCFSLFCGISCCFFNTVVGVGQFVYQRMTDHPRSRIARGRFRASAMPAAAGAAAGVRSPTRARPATCAGRPSRHSRTGPAGKPSRHACGRRGGTSTDGYHRRDDIVGGEICGIDVERGPCRHRTQPRPQQERGDALAGADAECINGPGWPAPAACRWRDARLRRAAPVAQRGFQLGPTDAAIAGHETGGILACLHDDLVVAGGAVRTRPTNRPRKRLPTGRRSCRRVPARRTPAARRPGSIGTWRFPARGTP